MASIRADRQHWNLISRSYQEKHDPQIGAAPRMRGMFSIPDARLHALGKITASASWNSAAAQASGPGRWPPRAQPWSASTCPRRSSPLHPRRMRADCYPLVQGAAEQLPFTPGSFEVVFRDHGGLNSAPPHLLVPKPRACCVTAAVWCSPSPVLGSRPEFILRPSRVIRCPSWSVKGV